MYVYLDQSSPVTFWQLFCCRTCRRVTLYCEIPDTKLIFSAPGELKVVFVTALVSVLFTNTMLIFVIVFEIVVPTPGVKFICCQERYIETVTLPFV